MKSFVTKWGTCSPISTSLLRRNYFCLNISHLCERNSVAPRLTMKYGFKRRENELQHGKRGVLSHEQPCQAELLCLPSVWFALSTQPHHLGAAVGVPLTEHLQQQGPLSSCWGCPFYHSSHLICWGEHQLKGCGHRPLTSDSTATCIGVIAATVFIHAATLAHKHNNNKKTCDSNLKLYISLISNHVASTSRNTCCLGSKQKQYESLIKPW